MQDPPARLFADSPPLPAQLESIASAIRGVDHWIVRKATRPFIRETIPWYRRFLYKYRSLVPAPSGEPPNSGFTNLSIDRLRDYIVRSEYRFSSPREFNDPFDMTTYVVIEGVNATDHDHFWKFAKDNPGMQDFFKKVFKSDVVTEEIPRARYQKISNTFLDSFGVFCFAGNPHNILMWSHYAANHTGVCFQFEVLRDFDTLIAAMPVEYGDEYPRFDVLSDQQASYSDVVLTKHRGWAYEEEYRLVSGDGSGQFFRLRPESLRSVIVGCRAGDDALRVVRGLLHERREARLPDINLYQMTTHPSSFRLVAKRIAQ